MIPCVCVCVACVLMIPCVCVCVCSLCPTLPIDIVYTWVNGSDQQLLNELKEIRRELLR